MFDFTKPFGYLEAFSTIFVVLVIFCVIFLALLKKAKNIKDND